MQETGLVLEWMNVYKQKPKQCFDREKQRRQEEIRNPPRLTLKNMTGTFAILGVGFVISFIVLITENTHSNCITRNNRVSKTPILTINIEIIQETPFLP